MKANKSLNHHESWWPSAMSRFPATFLSCDLWTKPTWVEGGHLGFSKKKQHKQQSFAAFPAVLPKSDPPWRNYSLLFCLLSPASLYLISQAEWKCSIFSGQSRFFLTFGPSCCSVNLPGCLWTEMFLFTKGLECKHARRKDGRKGKGIEGFCCLFTTTWNKISISGPEVANHRAINKRCC